MKHLCRCIAAAVFLSIAPLVAIGQEQTVMPTLERVSLFKNGFIIVHQIIDFPAPGLYRWDNVPVAVHGTFFTESDLDVEIRTTNRETTIPPAYSINQNPAQQVEKKPTMLFTVKALDGKSAGKMRMIYLTQGATWAPGYRIKLLDNKTLSLEQSVVILNEWMPIHEAEIALVSGFPQIENAGVLSPLHPNQTMRTFLAQLASPSSPILNDARGQMTQQGGSRTSELSRRGLAESFSENALDASAQAEGPDIHYNSIGKRTLEVNDSLVLTTGRGQAAYERVLSCDLSASALGQWLQLRTDARGANIQVNNPDVFEVVKFLNPLPFPMTTAPVAITDSQRFLGQSITNWVNPNQPASVNITKVLNVSISYSDELDFSQKPAQLPATPSSIPAISGIFGGDSADIPLWSVRVYPINSNGVYRLCPIQGTIEIANRRNEAVMLHLTSAVLGVVDFGKKAIAECDVAPKSQTVVPSREYVPNNVARLYWEIPLQPGEKKTITIKSSRWLFGQ